MESSSTSPTSRKNPGKKTAPKQSPHASPIASAMRAIMPIADRVPRGGSDSDDHTLKRDTRVGCTVTNPFTIDDDDDSDDESEENNSKKNDDIATILSIPESVSAPDNAGDSENSAFDWMSQASEKHFKSMDEDSFSLGAKETPKAIDAANPVTPRVASTFSQKEGNLPFSEVTVRYGTPEVAQYGVTKEPKISNIAKNAGKRNKGKKRRDYAILNGGRQAVKVAVSDKEKNNSGIITFGKKTSFLGIRIYAEYPGNDLWYWGLVVKEYFKSGKMFYTVWFDDGDVGENIPGSKTIHLLDYQLKWEKKYGKAPERPRHLVDYETNPDGSIVVDLEKCAMANADATDSDIDDADSRTTSSTWSPQRMFAKRCGKCMLCLRSSCGNCASCRHNNNGGSSDSRQAAAPHVCFRKMCVQIHEGKKAQPAIGFPEGWSFFFSVPPSKTSKSAGSSLAGLNIQSPSGVNFRSVEAARGRHKLQLSSMVNLKRDFFKHIGEAVPCTVATPDGKGTTNGKRKLYSKSGVNGNKRRKDEPVLSSTKEVGSRVYCQFTNGAYYWGEIVKKFQKEGSPVYHFAVQYDDGDFMNDVRDNSDDKDVVDYNVYTEEQYKEFLGKHPPRRRTHSLPAEPQRSTYTPTELLQHRCKKCDSCLKKDCKRCLSCQKNAKCRERLECCLQKMCSTIEKTKKKQPAPGLPNGWTFFSGEGPILTIQSPDNDEFEAIQDALDHCGTGSQNLDYDKAKTIFQTHVGGSLFFIDHTHALVGKQYCHVWSDVHERANVIYGEITECERDELDEKYVLFTVKYNEQALEDINAKSVFSMKVPRTQVLNINWALGGYNTFKEKTHMEAPLLIDGRQGFRWLTPDMRSEDMVKTIGGDGFLPRLTLVWNGYRIVFEVLPSTIPNAGYGVFVRCTSLVPNRIELRLNCLELLDLGVYAPFREEDMKEHCVSLMKNFIYNLGPEEWAFDAPLGCDYQYDITDDFTGQLHALAARHILCYVNECKMENIPTVNAEHDPQGAVHYLLGTKTTNLVLPTDDSRMEIFINYGEAYEKVRIRKNYSFLQSKKQQAAIMKTASEEACEYFEEIQTFSEHEVQKIVRFLRKVFTTDRKCSNDSVRRALAVAVLLRQRALKLRDGMGQSPFAVAFAEDVSLCCELVTTLLAMKDDTMLTEMNESKDFGRLIKAILSPFLIQLRPDKLAKIVLSYIEE